MIRSAPLLGWSANATVEAIKFGTNGTAGTLKTLKYSEAHSLQFDRRSMVNGRSMLRIVSEGLAGY